MVLTVGNYRGGLDVVVVFLRSWLMADADGVSHACLLLLQAAVRSLRVARRRPAPGPSARPR
jgi:hypothetical protein